MAAPCYESQVKDRIRATPALSKAFAEEMLDTMRGGKQGEALSKPKSFGEALMAMSEKSGLHPETINAILKRDPQVFQRTKQAIARSGELRKMRDSADQFAEQLKTSGKLYDPNEPGKIAKAWDVQRKIALAGHSVVFPFSHMRDLAVQIPTEAGRARMAAFWRSAFDVWKYLPTEAGRALHEMDTGLLRASDYYDWQKTNGLDVEPGKRNPGDIILQGKKQTASAMSFDTLKIARSSIASQIWDAADPAIKEGETGSAFMQMAMRDLNYATGSVMTPRGEAATPLAKTAAQLSELAGRYNLLLATKLFFAKHMNAVFGPLEYLPGTLGRSLSPAERAARNVAMGRWANTVATQMMILGANYGFNKFFGFQTPNISDPGEASTFLRLRFGNVIIPYSPILESLRLPVVMAYALSHKGTDSALTVAGRTLWNAAHPAAHLAAEQITGKDFRGQPIPSVRNLVAPVKGYEGMTVPEAAKYISTRFTPIALSGALREFYDSLKNQGFSPSVSTAIIRGLIAGVASGVTGVHGFEKGEPKTKAQKFKPGEEGSEPIQKRSGSKKFKPGPE